MTGLPGGPPHLSGVDRDDGRAYDDAPAVEHDEDGAYVPAGYPPAQPDDGTYSYAPVPAYEPDERAFHALVIGGVLLVLMGTAVELNARRRRNA